MKLWLLKPTENLPEGDNPWKPWYDKVFSFVARAETEEAARKYADCEAGDEGRDEFLGSKIANTTHPWLDSKYSICVELTAEGKSGIIIRDFASA